MHKLSTLSRTARFLRRSFSLYQEENVGKPLNQAPRKGIGAYLGPKYDPLGEDESDGEETEEFALLPAEVASSVVGRGPVAKAPPHEGYSADDRPLQDMLKIIQELRPDPDYHPIHGEPFDIPGAVPMVGTRTGGLMSWLARNGAVFPRIRVVDTGEIAEELDIGLGLVALDDFADRQFIAAIPARLVLHGGDARSSVIGASAAVASQMRRLSSLPRSKLSPVEIGVLEIMNADAVSGGLQSHVMKRMAACVDHAVYIIRSIRGQTAHHPWATRLPRDTISFFAYPGAVAQLPGVVDIDEGNKIVAFGVAFRMSFEVVWSLLPSHLKDSLDLTRGIFAWAMSMVFSRGIETVRDDRVRHVLNLAPDRPVDWLCDIVPLYDCINAPSHDGILPNVDMGEYVFKAEELVDEGLISDSCLAMTAAQAGLSVEDLPKPRGHYHCIRATTPIYRGQEILDDYKESPADTDRVMAAVRYSFYSRRRPMQKNILAVEPQLGEPTAIPP